MPWAKARTTILLATSLLVPKGRHEEGFKESWIRCHDEYRAARAG